MMTMMMKSNANAHFTPPPLGLLGASWPAFEVCHTVRRPLAPVWREDLMQAKDYTVESYEPELQAKVAKGYFESKNI